MSNKNNKPAVQPMSANLVSEYENKVRNAYESNELSIKTMRNEMAFNLGCLFKGKAHKAAGYDSFSEYVKERFPFKEVTPAQMCTWARTAAKYYYRDKETKEVKNRLGDGWELSTTERFNSLDADETIKAAHDGIIKPDMTQSDAKNYVSSKNASKGTKVVTMWKSTVTGTEYPESELKEVTDEELHRHTYKNEEVLYLFVVDKDGTAWHETFSKVKPEPKAKHPVGKTKEEIAESALAALDPETLKALVAKILG